MLRQSGRPKTCGRTNRTHRGCLAECGPVRCLTACAGARAAAGRVRGGGQGAAQRVLSRGGDCGSGGAHPDSNDGGGLSEAGGGGEREPRDPNRAHEAEAVHADQGQGGLRVEAVRAGRGVHDVRVGGVPAGGERPRLLAGAAC
eukprot:1189888-Prorocentrum_minimum.AAC.9